MAVVELIMPKMGESIIEATIINWLKQEGDQVDADETVLEIATDKVDSEVPSPVSGKIKKILVQVDDVVAVGAPMALIETDQEIDLEHPGPAHVEENETEEVSPVQEIEEGASSAAVKKIVETPEISQPVIHPPAKEATIKPPVPLSRKSLTNQIPSNVDGRFYSPLVRNIAMAEGISLKELNSLNGSGADGRVTKFDLLNYIDLLKLEATSSLKRSQTTRRTTQNQVSSLPDEPKKVNVSEEGVSVSSGPTAIDFGADEVIEVSRMRRVIAGHMRKSLDTAAHVSSFVEADATKLVNWRNKVKGEFLVKYGEKLTFSPLFTEIVVKALQDFPHINATFDGERMTIKKSINIGIATAMENGNLIVPVIENAGELNLRGLTRKLNDLTTRARKNKLLPSEIQNGTFSISNIGTFGNIMGTPIIPQPQLAILALGAIKKKPVIQETPEGDIIAIRHMMFLSLSFDHRVIDGYQGGIFLNRIAHYIETFDTKSSI